MKTQKSFMAKPLTPNTGMPGLFSSPSSLHKNKDNFDNQPGSPANNAVFGYARSPAAISPAALRTLSPNSVFSPNPTGSHKHERGFHTPGQENAPSKGSPVAPVNEH